MLKKAHVLDLFWPFYRVCWQRLLEYCIGTKSFCAFLLCSKTITLSYILLLKFLNKLVLLDDLSSFNFVIKYSFKILKIIICKDESNEIKFTLNHVDWIRPIAECL